MASPEPMSLGSPSTSPTGSSSQFLPQYLLGDPSFNVSTQLNPRNSTKFWTGGSSPPRSMGVSRSFSISTYDSNNKYTSIHQDKLQDSMYASHHSPSSQNLLHHHNVSHLDRTQQQDTRPGAPPINRLVDTINKPTQLNLTPKAGFNDSRRLNDTSMFDRTQQQQQQRQDISFTPGPRISPPSPTQIDPFYTHGESIKADDRFDETWVTVFGFPSSATSFILQEFSIYGQILKYVSSNGGNWMHIQYLTKLHAQKAMSKNGKILANSIMIGVLPCIDKKVMQQNQITDENQGKLPISSSETLMSKQTDFLANQTGAKLGRSSSLRTSVRPLGNRNERDGPNGDSRLPRKNTTVISKAMEYMFGW